MRLQILKMNDIKKIFELKHAKYLSQHDINRHYIIDYKEDNTFTNKTFENNKVIGMGYGKYNLYNNKDDKCMINIQYEKVYNSPNLDSPFNPLNNFYKELSNYEIGPLYTIIPNINVIWLPVLYKHLIKDRGFKVLNFYNK